MAASFCVDIGVGIVWSAWLGEGELQRAGGGIGGKGVILADTTAGSRDGGSCRWL